MVSGCLSGLADILPGFVAAPPGPDRAFWDGLPPKTRSMLIADAEAVHATAWPVLSAKAYRAYTETGNRVDFETAYFARRRRLNALALAELAEHEGRFIDALIDGIVLICEESGWQLPAHNSQQRDGTVDPLPDPDRPVIDLFAAETGAQLAVIAAVFASELDAVTPQIVKRIDREIATRITRPYLERHFWWMGDGDAPMINWTPWCTENVLVSTFARPTGQATRRAVIAKAAASLDAFLNSYAEDGACDEGPLYYRHAALSLFGALSVMDAVAPGVFSPLWQVPKLKNMAEYIVHTHVEGKWYVNFADASAVLDRCSAREFLFGKRVGSEALCALAAEDARADPRPDLPDEINLRYRLLALTMAGDMSAHAAAPKPAGDIFYPSCGLFVARNDRFVVAAKAGDNDDGHNHNDVGSVTVFKHGQPFLIDVGVETYSKKTFSPQRYDVWTMQSGFHNLPSFDGVQQQAGPEFAAHDVAVDLDGSTPTISMDIAGAYPPAAQVTSYRRTVRLDAGGAVEITDIFDGARGAELSLMLRERPELADGQIRVGALGRIDIAGAGPMRIEEIAIVDPRLRWAWPDRIFRVLVPFGGHELRLRIE